MNDYPNIVKEKLLSLIREMAASPALFVKNPEKDFIRERKLTLCTMLQLIISMGGNSIYHELLEAQGYDLNTATTSAFVQQRNKILPFAFEFLLRKFTQSFTAVNNFNGFKLFAVDGSDLHITTDTEDADTYFRGKTDESGYNLLHLNALYDLCNKIYVDFNIQPRKCINENAALATMVDRLNAGDKFIIITDRNYECYNTFAHIEKKAGYYLIRVKDVNSSGILSGLRLPNSECFDVLIHRILTKKHTQEVRDNPLIYRFISSTATFDFLDLQTNIFYPISFRVVRFKITDTSYETVITNLPQSSFSPVELKELYNMRWGIETSFRELKYTVGLINFHAKKKEYIIQEIYARTILYNFSEIITSHVAITQRDTRYFYQINFAVALLICRNFLFYCSNESPPDVEVLIKRNILPVRHGRMFKRNIRLKRVVSFNYRIT